MTLICRRRALTLALAFLAAVSAVVLACGGGESSDSGLPDTPPQTTAPFPVSLTDSSGKTLTFREAPKRIISYSPGATEILYAIGAGGQVIATDRFSDYPQEANSVPKLEYSRPAPEPALALTPELVIMATRQEGQVEQFRAASMAVLFLREPKDIAGVIEQIRVLGRITGRQEKADAMAKEMEGRVEAVRQKVSRADKSPLVFYEVSADGYTVAPDTFIGSLLKLVKAGNVAEGSTTAFPQLSAEVIIKANPDVIVLSDAGDSGGQSLATVSARPGWSGIKAVQSGRVHEIDPNIFNRPGPRIVEALELLVKLLHPNL